MMNIGERVRITTNVCQPINATTCQLSHKVGQSIPHDILYDDFC